jgi:hypothetical protein
MRLSVSEGRIAYPLSPGRYFPVSRLPVSNVPRHEAVFGLFSPSGNALGCRSSFALEVQAHMRKYEIGNHQAISPNKPGDRMPGIGFQYYRHSQEQYPRRDDCH